MTNAQQPTLSNITPALERLVGETFSLWDEKRVGFSWRTYYMAHTLRVRNLCLSLGEAEGCDPATLEPAALLHDVTKRYDGAIVSDEHGKRRTDKWGFWRNECMLPNAHRSNLVTKLYHHMDLYGELHSYSGALVARVVLELLGVPEGRALEVAETILSHVRPAQLDRHPLAPLYARPECRVLCDADLIDANLGLVAFYRNVQIHTHRRAKETGSAELRAYVEYVPRWLRSKEEFVPRLHTAAARDIGRARQRRCIEFHDRLTREVAQDFDLARRFGLLGVFDHFMTTHEDPDLMSELQFLRTQWLSQRRRELDSLPPARRRAGERLLISAREFCDLLQQEIDGAK